MAKRRLALVEVPEESCIDGCVDSSFTNEDYYRRQSPHDIHKLGADRNRMKVHIWIEGGVDRIWKQCLSEAVEAINEAAPGLSLSITRNQAEAIVHVKAIGEMEASTTGSILWYRNDSSITIIELGIWDDDMKQGTSIHELLHALGFQHEHQRADAHRYLHADQQILQPDGNQIEIRGDWHCLTQFDPLSIMLYPECTRTYEANNSPVWWLNLIQHKKIPC
jgi:hypothetical protein